MFRVAFAVVVTLCLTVDAAGAASIPHTELLKKVLASVEAGLKFFSGDYSSINVDGLFGLRLGQGQLIEAIRECEERHCGVAIVRKLRSVERELRETCEAALPYVKADDEIYYDRFIMWIDKPYISPYVPTEFDDQRGDLRPVGNTRSYNEGKGDDCYCRIMGTYEEKATGNMTPKCNLTQECWNYMTKNGTARYFITHQLLYFIMVDHFECRETIERWNGGRSMFEIYRDMCENIYNEARHFTTRGDVLMNRKDLFLEQTVLCGTLGFEDFMRPHWIRVVLQWPDREHGCFKLVPSDFDKERDAQKTVLCGTLGFEDFMRPDWIRMVLQWPDREHGCFKLVPSDFDQEMHRQGHDHKKEDDSDIFDMIKENWMYELEASKSKTMRGLLRERPMKDGCLSHTSGLGFGVMNTYLRFLLKYL